MIFGADFSMGSFDFSDFQLFICFLIIAAFVLTVCTFGGLMLHTAFSL